MILKVVDSNSVQIQILLSTKMADMLTISILARQIHKTVAQLTLPTHPQDPLGDIGKSQQIMAVISQIDGADLTNLDHLVGRVAATISKTASNGRNDGRSAQQQNFYKILSQQQPKEQDQLPEKRDHCPIQISKVSFAFVQKIAHLFRQYTMDIENIHPEGQKQNRTQGGKFDDYSWQKLLRIMHDFRNEVCRLSEMIHKPVQNDQDRIWCQSEGGKKHANTPSNSSCRSLLTEKLKNIAVAENDEEQGEFCASDKMVIKGNWVLREMKGNRNQKGSQPRQQLHSEEESYQTIMRSMGGLALQKRLEKAEAPTKRSILEQMRPFAQAKKQQKAKKNESGCARCQIY